MRAVTSKNRSPYPGQEDRNAVGFDGSDVTDCSEAPPEPRHDAVEIRLFDTDYSAHQHSVVRPFHEAVWAVTPSRVSMFLALGTNGGALQILLQNTSLLPLMSIAHLQ